MAIRVLHVIHGVEKEQTGAGYSVPGLCRALAQKGIKITLVALSLGGDLPECSHQMEGLEFRRFPYIGPKRIGYSPWLRSFVREALNQVDIVQTHFLWSYPEAFASRLALKNRKTLVKTPHGALFPEALAKSSLAKLIWYRFIDGPALENAQCVVATSESEAGCLTDRFRCKRLEVIPNAIDPPDLPDKNTSWQRAHEIMGNPEGKYVLFLGNLHPHKNLEKLIALWPQVQKNWPQHILILVGPGEAGYMKRLQRLIHRLGMAERIRVCDPVYGPDKWALLNAAETLVLPSKSENFGLVVAEALYCGTPVVASRGTPWPVLETGSLGHWVEAEDGLLAEAIQDVLAWPAPRRQKMAQDGRALIESRHIWDKIADQYIRLYRDLLC